jgi:hypothetical protein
MNRLDRIYIKGWIYFAREQWTLYPMLLWYSHWSALLGIVVVNRCSIMYCTVSGFQTRIVFEEKFAPSNSAYSVSEVSVNKFFDSKVQKISLYDEWIICKRIFQIIHEQVRFPTTKFSRTLLSVKTLSWRILALKNEAFLSFSGIPLMG